MSYSPTVYCASMVTPSAFARLAESLATEARPPPWASRCCTRGARTDSDRSTRRAAAPSTRRGGRRAPCRRRGSARAVRNVGTGMTMANSFGSPSKSFAMVITVRSPSRTSTTCDALLNSFVSAFADVETAEAEDRRRRPGDDRHQRDTEQRSSHDLLQQVIRRTLFGVTLASLVASSTPAVLGFCGFYVAKADTKLFNKASQVVLVRDGDRTVLTMANDFKGDRRSSRSSSRCRRCCRRSRSTSATRRSSITSTPTRRRGWSSTSTTIPASAAMYEDDRR